ncbi:E3 binding domain-containing protein [Roseibium salinum]
MSDVIAPPSVRALARQKGIDIEKLARDIGRTSIAREDVEGGMGRQARVR